MENKMTLRDVPKEYFGKFRTKNEDKGALWGSMLGMLPIAVLSLGWEGELSRRVTLTLLCLYLLQMIPALFFSFERTVRRFRGGFILCTLLSMELMYLLISNLFYGANAMYIDGLYDNVQGEEVTYFCAALIILQHIVMLFLFRRRINRCIVSGCYLPGGTGFWSKKLLPKIGLISAIMPALFTLSLRLARGGSACSGSITLTETLYPFVAFILFLLAEALSVIFSYGNANLLARYSYVKIHGCDEENAAEADVQEIQESDD